MKTRTWLILFAALALICVLLIPVLFRKTLCTRAEVWSEGKRIAILDLSKPQSFTVETERGTNVVTVRDGTVCVSEASCPDQICVRRGGCSGGAPVICLPNRLVIRFLRSDGPDAVTG